MEAAEPPQSATPSQPSKPKRHLLKAAAGIFVALGLLLLKLKGVLLILASKFKLLLVNPFEGFGIAQFVTTGVSMVVSVVAHAIQGGWAVGIGVTLLIVVHELGHAVMMRAKGLRPNAMVFIPFVGGAVVPKDEPRSAYIEAQIGLAGPITGTLGAFVCLQIYSINQQSVYLVLAYFGFLINLFNLIPATPLDGGKIAGAITKWMWAIGSLVLLWFTVRTRNPLLVVVLLLSLYHIRRAMKGESGPGFYDITTGERTSIAVVYFTLLVTVAWFTSVTHAELGI